MMRLSITSLCCITTISICTSFERAYCVCVHCFIQKQIKLYSATRIIYLMCSTYVPASAHSAALQ